MKQEYEIKGKFVFDDNRAPNLDGDHFIMIDNWSPGIPLTDVTIKKVEQRRYGKTKVEYQNFISMLGKPELDSDDYLVKDVFQSILKEFDDEPVEEKVCSNCKGKTRFDGRGQYIPCPECNSGGGV